VEFAPHVTKVCTNRNKYSAPSCPPLLIGKLPLEPIRYKTVRTREFVWKVVVIEPIRPSFYVLSYCC